jgi:hypothetical protein
VEAARHNTADRGDTIIPPSSDKPRGVQLHDLVSLRDTLNIHVGEGWAETMKSMGIPQHQWADVLNDAGPKLHEQGWSYFDKTHNEWRISHSGVLSEQALQTLKDSSAKFGYAFTR